ncbi:hypothetical protein [Actinoplanes subtropicus]|uniref:hypothetical protein n=1 Tax=Actinoplanes subtropicus TaxID=543632 RepID=UPI0004C41584|nr:hypothetical protein [Actinoplanes subtropicus]
MIMSSHKPESPASRLSDDDLGRLVYEAVSPHAGERAPTAAPTPQQILQRAWRRRRARRLRLLAAVTRCAAVVVAVLIITAGIVVAKRAAPAGRAAARPAVALLPLPRPSTWRPARVGLTRLSQTVARLHETPAAGRYTYTRTRLWARDATAASPANAVTVFDEQRWWSAERAGRQTRATVTGWSPGQDPGPVRRPDAGGDESYRTGQMPVVVPDLSSNVFVVSSQLAEQQDPADGPQATLRAVREVYRFHDPVPAQRAALLQALADTDGLLIAGTVDGGIGRRGLAVLVDSDHGATRDIAIFDPVTGRMLAYDTVWLRAPAAVTIATPALADSLLLITATRTSSIRHAP